MSEREPGPGWREEVKMMIALAISQFHGQQVERLTKIDNTLANQDDKLSKLDEGQVYIIKQLGEITTNTSFWSKAKFYKSLPVWLAIILSLFGAVIGYLTYRAHVGKEITQGPHAQVETIPADASN